MKIYSGNCCLCDVGRKTGAVDIRGRELHTGDVVQLWHGNYLGTDLEEWMPADGLTAIVANQYQSYTDGTIVVLDDEAEAYAMGIKSFGLRSAEWRLSLVKSYADIIAGERFMSYGFNYRD